MENTLAGKLRELVEEYGWQALMDEVAKDWIYKVEQRMKVLGLKTPINEDSAAHNFTGLGEGFIRWSDPPKDDKETEK